MRGESWTIGSCAARTSASVRTESASRRARGGVTRWRPRSPARGRVTSSRRTRPLLSAPASATRGAAEGRMSDVVGERDRLGEVLVQAQGAGGRARDLRDLDRVREARAVVVALVVDEHLRLVDEAPEGARVDDPLAVALVGGAQLVLGLLHGPPGRPAAGHGP